MHSTLVRRLSFFLASWLMVTSVGASIDVHFCKGEIYSIGINAEADKCAGFENENSQKDHSSLQQSPCCDQFSAYFQSDVDSGNDDVAIQYSIDSFVIPFQHEVQIPNCVEPIQLCHFYHPPEYEEDLLTLFSVFRI
jgi:hypothetical protein